MSSIRLHPKYGVNPTMPTCFWCGKDTGEIALLGAAYPKEAPMRMVMNYDPCDECRKNMAQGISIIEAKTRPTHENQRSLIAEGQAFPTGRWWVLKEEAIHRLIKDEKLRDQILRMKTCLMDPETVKAIGLGESHDKDEQDERSGTAEAG